MEKSKNLIWKYIRGDISNEDFESFIYNEEVFGEYFGESFYTEIISNDFKNKDTTFLLRKKILDFQRNRYNEKCKCNEIKDIAVFDMGEESDFYMSTFHNIVNRGNAFWWLYLTLCKICNQYWLVAQEERQNDVFCLYRLEDKKAQDILNNNLWPDIFDKYVNLLKLGYNAGKSVRFVDPIFDSSLSITMIDVAKEHPGIALSELAKLLNLDLSLASYIAEAAIRSSGVKIELKQ